MKYLLPILTISMLLAFPKQQVYAAISEGSQYRIEQQSIDVLPYQTPTTVPKKEQPAVEYAQGRNFIVSTTTPQGFTLTIPALSINFGKPETTTPIVRTSSLMIDSSTPYIILGSQDHPLTAGMLILPNTTCDNGSCSESIASLWESNLTYGVGFHCDGKNICPNDFQKNYFRPFSDRSQGYRPQIVMTGKKGKNQKGTITYRIVTSATQQEANYQNTIQYIAMPEL